MTREEIIIKIKGKKSEYVEKALNTLERNMRRGFTKNLKQ